MPIPAEWSLTGRSVLVATSGQGWAPTLAEGLAEAGADVALVGAPQPELEAAADAVERRGRRVLALPADLTRPAAVRQVMRRVVRAFGRLDALVNHTQVPFAKPALEVTPAEFDRVMALNVKSAFLCCQEAARYMLEQGSGRMVNIASALAERGLWNESVYCASMGALVQLTRALALEWGRQGVRVNGIGPGWFSPEEVPLEKQREQRLVRFLPSRRLGHPRDIVPLLVYLCSEACTYTTGQTIYVDGGALSHA